MAMLNSKPITNLEKTFAKEPSIPIAPKNFVSKVEIPIIGEGYNLATAESTKTAATTILITQTILLFLSELISKKVKLIY